MSLVWFSLSRTMDQWEIVFICITIM